MKNLLRSLVLLFGIFVSASCLAQAAGGGGASSPKFNGGTVGNSINAPAFNATGASPFNYAGNNFLLPYGTGSVAWGSDTCSNLCSLLLGSGAGINLPSNDYLSMCIGWRACALDSIQRPEVVCIGWRACGNGDGATFGFNVAVGINALGSCTSTCIRSSILGVDAARDAFIFNDSVAVGNGAAVNGTLSTSVAVGSGAANWNQSSGSTNSDIIAIGYRALFGNAATTAQDDTAIGDSVFSNITSGSHNIGIGSSAGQTLTSTSQAVFIGWKSGSFVTGSAGNSVCVGVLTCSSSTVGTGETAVGFQAGQALNSTAFDNVLYGRAAGILISSGNGNICLGPGSCSTLTTGSANLVIGGGTPPTATTSNYITIRGVLIGYSTAPTIASGFGISPSIAGTGTFEFEVTVGTGGLDSSGILTMPAAPNYWDCDAKDITTISATVFITRQTTTGTTPTTRVELSNMTTGIIAGPWAAGDVLRVKCLAR